MTKYSIQEINSIAKNMKYEALYWTLGFVEYKKNIFEKNYSGLIVIINSEKQYVDFNNKITVVHGDKLLLNTHKSFVVLECIDKLLSMGYLPSEIIVDLDNEYDIYCTNLYIKCFEWGHIEADEIEFRKDVFYSIFYESRLVSGVIERKYSVKTSHKTYDKGIFELENKQYHYCLDNSISETIDDFVVESGVAKKYVGSNKTVRIPDGVVELATCLFWDNQAIEEVILPDTLTNISGDTFYNCKNLKKVVITKNVKYMGNNPFAGCPFISIENESPYFNIQDGVLYNKDFSKLIYYPIAKKDKEYYVIDGCKIIGKHSFYLCDNLENVKLPNSIIKLENNPFSGCTKLRIDNNSSYYHIDDCVIYDKDYTSVIGCLNSINTDVLVLKDVKRICRNSFWNCAGIRKIVLPKSLEEIGYNPFVSCSNISFESKSDNFVVYNNGLYNKDKTTLICYPHNYAIGDINLPDEVITLERGAFSGCDQMTKINLHNVSIISKTCFTNCNALKGVYCSDLVAYIGEWAFAHCNSLQEVSIYKDCFVDKNVLLNSNATLCKREELSNYVVESDKIYSLLSMRKNYLGKVKSIIIDPPYNSHIDYIGYEDAYNDDYISFIEKRLAVSVDLLSKDGFLVINIDEGEVDNLKTLCEKYFYKVRVCKWEKLHPFFDKNRSVSPDKKVVKYEYIIICFKSKLSKLNKLYQPYIENGEIKEKESDVPNIFKCFGTNSSAKDEMTEIFGRRDYFQTPKPLKLIKELIRATSNKDSIVLDYFAGSGTTGHAVVELNNEDNGNRKYILISNDESNICQDVTLKRIQKVDQNVVFIK